MAATLTKIAGPTAIGPGLKLATYTVAMDSSYPTGGEAIDLTGEFTYVYAVICGGNDTAADNDYIFRSIYPGATTAVTSSNVLIHAHWSGTAGAKVDEFTNTGNLSAVGGLTVTVIGA